MPGDVKRRRAFYLSAPSSDFNLTIMKTALPLIIMMSKLSTYFNNNANSTNFERRPMFRRSLVQRIFTERLRLLKPLYAIMQNMLLFISLVCISNSTFSQWNAIYESDEYYFTDVFFLNDTVGFISGGIKPFINGGYNKGIILNTKDCGITWDTIHVPTEAHNIHFFDTLNGFVASNRDICYRTYDGGQTWDTIFTGYYNWNGFFQPFNNISHLYFSDSMTCFITHNRTSGELGMSTDGGFTWNFEHYPINNPSSCIQGSAVQSGKDNPNILFAGVYYKSYDGGNTWYENDSLIPPYALVGYFRDLKYFDSKVGWFGAFTNFWIPGDYFRVGTIGKTINGGNTWVETFFDRSIIDIVSIDIVSLKTIYASVEPHPGDPDNKIYFLKSIDNGNHWYFQEHFPKVNCSEMSKVYAVNDFVAFGLCKDFDGIGYIFKTENGGGPLYEAPLLSDNEITFKESLEVFPNPTNDRFQISKKFSYPVIMNIYSTDGRLYSVSEFKSNELITKDVSAFPTGIYKIELYSSQGEYFMSSLIKF